MMIVFKLGEKGKYCYKIFTYKNIDYGLPSASGEAMFTINNGKLFRSGFRRVITK